MFPTTVWDDIEAAAGRDPAALDRLAQQYRPAIVAFIRRRGIDGGLAEDLCHDVFARVMSGDVLSKADAGRGRFRSLLCTITIRVIQDYNRRRADVPVGDVDAGALESDFDRIWALHLLDRGFQRLRENSPASYEVLCDHLAGGKPDRQKLWIARGKLVSFIRREIAGTCRSAQEVDEEVLSLSPYLRPEQKPKKV